MWTLATALSLTAFQGEVAGLRRGEVVRETAGFEPGAPGELAFGRVLDAATSVPLSGVTIESWTEDWTEPAVKLDEVASERDGTFVGRRKRDGREAEKVRLSAAGYRSTTRAMSDVFDDVLLVRAPAPAALTVLDLQGRPITGARFTTRQTCAHAPPAIEVRSDASGRFDLSLLPPLADEPEGQIDAPGFEALRSIEPETLLACGNWTPEVYLGRKRPLRVRVLERDGKPAARVRIVLGDAPRWQARNTDEQGRVVFDSIFADTPILLRVARGGVLEPLVECCAWREAQITLRLGGSAADREREDDDAEVVVSCDERGAPWLLVHEQGWFVDRLGTSHLPPGRCTIFSGADFSGWREHKEEFVLAPREKKELAFSFEPEPRVKVALADAEDAEVVIESDGHSMRWAHGAAESFPAPPGVPLTVVVARPRQAWRFEVPPLEGDAVVACERYQEWRREEEWHITTIDERIALPPELATPLKASVSGPSATTRDLSSVNGPSLWVFRRSNEPAELWLRADGYLSRAFVAAWNDPWRVDAKLAALATLELRGDVARVLGPHGEVDFDERGIATLDELAPGPLTVRVQRGDGRWLALDLELVPGEARVLELR